MVEMMSDFITLIEVVAGIHLAVLVFQAVALYVGFDVISKDLTKINDSLEKNNELLRRIEECEKEK